jgi:tetratricopeptide (TPR) repeat protein
MIMVIAVGRDKKKKIDAATPPGASQPGKPPLSRKRLWLFRTLAISFPLVVLFLAEIAFRIIPGLNDERDPYVNISPLAVFSRTTVDGKEYYNITNRYVLGGSAVHFPVKKPADTIRIFCVGSSACAGWPHPATEKFSAYLQQALETAYPGKKVEVINAAAHGFAAYRTRRVLDEVLQMEPDAAIVWEGNNEFLEERNYDPPSKLITDLTRHLRTVQWVRARMTSRTEMSGEQLKDVAQTFWKKTHQQSLRLRQDPVQFAQVQEHFHESFRHMIDQSQRYKVPILLCTVPVNMRDWLPTVSCNRLDGEKREQWQKLFYQARRCLLESNYQSGIQAMNQAIGLESEHAESYFWLGRLLEADGQKTAAWDAFNQARDLDYNPFRAISSFNESIRALAKENDGKGVYLLDLERLFTDASKYAAPGFDLFLDYVHPTKPANLIVAQNAFDLLIRRVLKDPPAIEHFSYRDLPIPPNNEPYRDETDLAMRSGEITLAVINHQYETIINESEAVIRQASGHQLTGPNDPILANCDPPEFAERYRVFWNYVDVQRRTILGLPVREAEQKEAVRQVDQFYDKWYPLGKY